MPNFFFTSLTLAPMLMPEKDHFGEVTVAAV
jgi:hypothetical protein